MAAARRICVHKHQLGKAAKIKQAENERRADLLMQKYDVDNSGHLERNEMIRLLTAFNFGSTPEDAVVDDIMNSITTKDEPAVCRRQINTAIAQWSAYMKEREFIEARLRKYDVDKSGDLQKSEVMLMMKDMNKGEVPSEDEVNFVMECGGNKLGALTPNELRKACGLWKEIITERQAQSSVCVVL